MLNLVAISGNLTRDPNLSYTTGNTAVCEFGIAINEKRKGQEKTHFVTCKAFGKTAEFVNQYFRKGKSITVVGKLDFSEWTDKEGNKRSRLEVIANDVQFCIGKSDGDQQQGPAREQRPARSAPRREPEPQSGNGIGPPIENDPNIPF
jgi:single-strand DNA-binding protein